MKKARKAKAALIKPDVEVVESVEAELYKRVRSYIAKARAKVYAVANKEMVAAYWNVGREIVEKQGGAERAKYGDGLIKGLSLKLTASSAPATHRQTSSTCDWYFWHSQIVTHCVTN